MRRRIGRRRKTLKSLRFRGNNKVQISERLLELGIVEPKCSLKVAKTPAQKLWLYEGKGLGKLFEAAVSKLSSDRIISLDIENITERAASINGRRVRVNHMIIEYSLLHAHRDHSLDFYIAKDMVITDCTNTPTGPLMVSHLIKTGEFQLGAVIMKVMMSGLSMEVDNLRFENIGGLGRVKETIRTILMDRVKNREVYENLHLSKRHILLIGPPGVGKSMIMSAVYHELKEDFFILPFSFTLFQCPIEATSYLLNQFSKLAGKPVILLYDEIDELGGIRGMDGSGTSELLRVLDGVENSNVYFIAATNRPSSLDPALLRFKRFNPVIVVPLPTKEERKAIIGIHTKDFKLADKETLEHFARLTDGFSGADIKEVIDHVIYDQMGHGVKTPKDVVIRPSCLDRVVQEVGEPIRKRSEYWNRMQSEWLKGTETNVMYG